MNKSRRQARHKSIRKFLRGNSDCPRLSVFRSAQHIYAQLIDDQKGETIASSCDIAIKDGTKKEKAEKVGEDLAKLALSKKIKKIVFDRGGFRYHGRVESLAKGARKGGLEF